LDFGLNVSNKQTTASKHHKTCTIRNHAEWDGSQKTNRQTEREGERARESEGTGREECEQQNKTFGQGASIKTSSRSWAKTSMRKSTSITDII
jgi:hypothetical protein